MLKEAEAYADGEIVGRVSIGQSRSIRRQFRLALPMPWSVWRTFIFRGGRPHFAMRIRPSPMRSRPGTGSAGRNGTIPQANGKLDEAIDRLTAAARRNNSSAAVELCEYASERAQDPNVGAQWLRLALKTMSDVPREKVHLASVMLMPSDIRLNLRGAAMLRELAGVKSRCCRRPVQRLY